MAVLGLVQGLSIQYDNNNAGRFKIIVQIVGVDPSNPVEDYIEVNNILPGLLGATLQGAIESAVKSYLQASYGYSFGLLDTVRQVYPIV